MPDLAPDACMVGHNISWAICLMVMSYIDITRWPNCALDPAGFLTKSNVCLKNWHLILTRFSVILFPDQSAYTDTHGSWFLEELVLIFELYAHVDDLDTMTRKVNGPPIHAV